MTTPFGDFGAPPDAVAWTALVLAIALLGVSFHRAFVARVVAPSSRRFVVASLAMTAALLSWIYVRVYLQGGPRIIDATTYYLQARALAEGYVAFPIPSPSGAFRGRFLLANVDAARLAAIFPPGYPAILALGFLARAPMLVGPLIAAALVVATYALARRLFEDDRVALLASALSVVCVVLRYHTADTMSHGWAALLLTTALWSSLGRSRGSATLSGASVGWLVATRPISGVVGLLIATLGVLSTPRRLVWFVGATLIPVLLFVVEQRLATGTWLGSTQLAYYAVADGPPGCFRYGFGANIGCVAEHGDFVRAHLAHGYGVVAALGTTLRRLKMHLADAGNVEFFFPVLVCGVAAAFRLRPARLASLGVVLLVAAYVPFYFDGNYPGGGARFFADALPLEHVLLAFALVRLRAVRVALPLALVGFALHTAYDHRRLEAREGGRPMFEPGVLAAAGVRHGLVFVDTDHGFNLGFDPARTNAQDDIVVARRRRDAHDAILWDRLGRPLAFSYEFEPGVERASPRVVPLALTLDEPLRIEAEAEWPPLAVESGFVQLSFPPCASGHRALSIRPVGSRAARVRLEIPVPEPGRYQMRTGWVTDLAGPAPVQVTSPHMSTTVLVGPSARGCSVTDGPRIDVPGKTEYIDISTTYDIQLDYVDLTRVP